MYNILKLNKIAEIGTSRLGENYNCTDACDAPDGILVRSAVMHDMELPESLLAIARAGAGVNNIPLDKCTERGICVFNTPGANANAVKELVVAGLLLASRKIAQGVQWNLTLKDDPNCLKSVEKGKSQFAGPELMHKTIGVVGLGAIGVLVAIAAAAMGMHVVGYDPYLKEETKKMLSFATFEDDINDLYKQSDYITFHLPLNDGTRGMINDEAINMMTKWKKGVRILNFSRDGLVVSSDIIAGLKDGRIAAYVTDFATQDLLGVDGVVAIPHLGASTPESEDNCAVMAADEIKEYFEQGTVRNSVNFPNLSAPMSGDTRFCVFYKNGSGIVDKLVEAVGDTVDVQTAVRGDYAYTVIDTNSAAEGAADAISAIDGVVRCRVIG